MSNKTSMPLVSIIIATFNAGKTLHRSLESVIRQQFTDWECIIVDGASTDDTVSIIKKYSVADPRFRFISESDKGIYDAFNKGWKMAKGDWIFYLGSDDVVTVNGIYNLMNIENRDDYDILYGDMGILYPDGRYKTINMLPFQEKKAIVPSHQAIVTKRKIIEKYGGFDEKFRIIADKDLTYTILRNAGLIKKTDTVVSVFTLGGASSSIKKKIKENIYFTKKHNMGLGYMMYSNCMYFKQIIGSMIFRVVFILKHI